jgi:hypothetical protein
MLSTIYNATADYKKAKIAEALTQFYFSDVWKIIDNQFPVWLKHFLKYSQAIYKISYMETDYNPDLLLEVIDRALLYIEPTAKRVQDAQWIMERYFISKHEVMERVDRGDWEIPEDDIATFETHMTIGNTTDDELSRFMGSSKVNMPTVEVDELVEIIDYWQYPRKGLADVYAVMVGGIEGTLVRYGRNFNPYKYNQYIASSYNQNDRPDGIGLAEQIRPFQKVINSWVNLRNDDVLANVQAANLIDGDLVDAETQDDLDKGRRLIRAAPEVAQAIRSAGGKLTDSMAPFPSGTSTKELFQDLAFVLGQRQETSHISDVFRGASPPPGTPLGIVQEQLTRSAGHFKPVIRQVMLPFERMSEIMLEYFKNDEFFSKDRVISIIGRNRYADVIDGWQDISGDGNVQALQVSPDQMDVDVTFNAVSGADAFAAKTMLNSTIANLLQGLGQVPEVAAIVSEEFNFANMWEHMLNVSGLDIDRLKYTPQEKQERILKQQQQQQQQQQLLEQQQQQQLDFQQALKSVEAQAQIMIDAAKQEMKQKTQIAIDEAKISAQTQSDLEEVVLKIVQQKMADMQINKQQSELTKDEMRLEGEIEKDNQVKNVNPAGGQNIQQNK